MIYWKSEALNDLAPTVFSGARFPYPSPLGETGGVALTFSSDMRSTFLKNGVSYNNKNGKYRSMAAEISGRRAGLGSSLLGLKLPLINCCGDL